jgi:NTP pyrophosphatase (non-canonical NTP hydrolase)
MAGSKVADSEATVEQLKHKVRAFCSEREWDPFHGAKDLSIGVVTEAAELLEIFRFQSEAQCAELLANDVTRTAVADELADILFFVLRFAGRFDFDLARALDAKLVKNARKYPVEKSRGSNKKYDQLD